MDGETSCIWMGGKNGSSSHNRSSCHNRSSVLNRSSCLNRSSFLNKSSCLNRRSCLNRSSFLNKSSYLNRSSSHNRSRSNSKRSRLRDHMDRSRSLFGSQTSSSSVIESSLEFSFGSSDIFYVIKVGRSDLRSLYVIVDWMEGVRTESCVFSCFSRSECSLECSLGFSNLRSVFDGSSGSHGQEGTDELGRGCSG